jgi:selenide,water dikinase
VDIITAIADDPYSFGMIAAANALSDVYTMGGKPIIAMNIIAFPTETLEISVMTQILNGALAKLDEAGATLIGGHSIKDTELKYGLCVTGTVHPDRVITRSGAQVGDKLILTKPLGTGILAAAVKAGLVNDKTKNKLIRQMTRLNKDAAGVLVSIGAHACSDITGFGFIGHACEMAQNSGVTIELYHDKIPLIKGVERFAQQGLVPGGSCDNSRFYGHMTESIDRLDKWLADILYDAQTSGGLLISVSPEKADEMLAGIKEAGDGEAAIVGQVVAEQKSKIIVL